MKNLDKCELKWAALANYISDREDELNERMDNCIGVGDRKGVGLAMVRLNELERLVSFLTTGATNCS